MTMKATYSIKINCDGTPFFMEVCDTFANVIKRAKEKAREIGWKHSAALHVLLNGKTIWRGHAIGFGANIREHFNAVQEVPSGAIEHLALFIGGERVQKAPRGARVVLAYAAGRGLFALDGKFYIVGL